MREIPEEVARAAKLMVVSYPNNPTTAMAPDSFYLDLIAFARKYGIIVLHDNAYSELVFDGESCGSFLRFPGAKEVGVEFNSLSKTYGLAGARVGFCIGNREVVSMLSTPQVEHRTTACSCPSRRPPSPRSPATRRASPRPAAPTSDRRDILCDGLTAIGWPVEQSRGHDVRLGQAPRGPDRRPGVRHRSCSQKPACS